MNYWRECVDVALDEAGIVATEMQREMITEVIEGAFDCYGMAHGHDAIPNPLEAELKETKQALLTEKSKKTCPECGGKGETVSFGPIHKAVSQCWRCRGEGRV